MWTALVCFLLATPCLFLGVLGLVGIAADMSYPENRAIGVQSLGYAAIPLGLAAVALIIALALPRSKAK